MLMGWRGSARGLGCECTCTLHDSIVDPVDCIGSMITSFVKGLCFCMCVPMYAVFGRETILKPHYV